MTSPIRIGLIGLDTGHVVTTSAMLNDPAHEWHIPGAKVVIACADASLDFFNHSRVATYETAIRDSYGVPIVQSIREVAEASDVNFLSAIDARSRLRQFNEILEFRKPVIVEKPLTLHYSDAVTMFEAAAAVGIPLFCCSTLRYAQNFTEAMRNCDSQTILGADVSGPMPMEPQLPGLFWYGVHMTELLYASLGIGCKRVTATSSEIHDVITGEWKDGRIGTVRGNRAGNSAFHLLLHFEDKSRWIDVRSHPKPDFASFLEKALDMVRTGQSPIPASEALEIIRFMEAANESRRTGKTVEL